MSKAAVSYELLTARNWQRGAVYATLLRFRPTKSEHELIRKELDWQHRLTVADAIAHYYNTEVFIPPQFDNQFDERYAFFYADAPVAGKMPDLIFDRLFWEMKSYEDGFRPDDFTDMIQEGKKQSPNIIVLLRHEYDIDLLRRRTQGYIRSNNLNRKVKHRVERVIIVDTNGNVHNA